MHERRGAARTNQSGGGVVLADGHCTSRAWVARLAEEGGGKGEASNVKSPNRLTAALFAVAVAAAVAATSGSAKTHVSSGGTLRVGWEQAFGFTDTFDPTGEYLGDAIGIYSSLLVRTLVG